MNTKDYELIAACLGASYKRYLGNEIAMKAIQDVESRLMLELSLENLRFNRTKFVSRIQYWIGQH